MTDSTWVEISRAKTENRHELHLVGPSISKQIDDAGLDPHLFLLTSLNLLNICDTSLSELPDDIRELNNIIHLLIHSNKLTALPAGIGSLTKIKMLDASHNLLNSIPEEIKNLSTLAMLNLSTNQLTNLPSLASNVKLSKLDLSHNKFEEFPDICHPELVNLAELLLNGNNIKDIPTNINCLVSLRYFNFEDNVLEVVPGEISDLTKLKEFHLQGNKLNDKRLSKLILQGRLKQILDYIKQNCPRIGTTTESAQGGGGKGKKGKKGKKGDQGNVGASLGEEDERARMQLNVTRGAEPQLTVILTKEAKTVRPFILCCIVRKVTFSPDTLKKFIQLQTKLHNGPCEKRNAATIATHDLDLVGPAAEGPLVFTARPPEELLIKPLTRHREYRASELLSQLMQEAEDLRKEKKRNTFSGIHRYLYLLESKPLYACLVDSKRTVISFPPITNSDITKVSVGTTNLLLEVTSSTDQGTCRKVLDSLLREMLPLCLATAQGPHGAYPSLVLEQVKVTDLEGNLKSVYPSRTDLVFEESHVVVVRE